MSENKILISSKLLFVLVIVLIACFMIIAFFLGRESVRNAVNTGYAPSPHMSNPKQDHAFFPAPPQQPEYSAPAIIVSPPTSSTSPIHTPLPLSTTPETNYHTVVSSTTYSKMHRQNPSDLKANEKIQIINYFAKYEEIGSNAKYWDDPNNLAQECIRAAMAGDTSGIDRLIESYRNFQYGIVKLNAPKVCKEHQNKTVEALGYSIQLLESMKNGIVKGDITAIQNLQAKAQTAKEKGEEADHLEKQIKAAYGIN